MDRGLVLLCAARAGGGGRAYRGPPWYATWNRRAARQPIAMLARLNPAVLASGHGRPMTGTETAAAVSAFAGLTINR